MKPIAKGDLVVMVRGHQCVFDSVGGIPFTVSGFAIPNNEEGWICSKCAAIGPDERAAKGLHTWNIPLSWLQRFDPDVLKDEIPELAKIKA